ncbi:ankyrin repeat family protein [Rhynchospora pubera]|uniref:Ankyrin repeat family protein n=1 Tax=Rhynchospora pubera TaxID=906938 RepID=A0AAV8E225_9POAL|nr:ankyrin repeat family protein [Rhynchospora pubera]KAJ4775498.1 ankyrin repeat family protein [Rhynchospora pubera]
MLGHDKFADKVWTKFPSLLSDTNKDWETPLMAALMADNVTLASQMLTAASTLLEPADNTSDVERGNPFKEMLLKVDKRGDNALHHAIRRGFVDITVRPLNTEPTLAEKPNNVAESPMQIAAREGRSEFVKKSVKIIKSADPGPAPAGHSHSALHVDVKMGHPESPMYIAARKGHFDFVKELLKTEKSADSGPAGYSALHVAVEMGHTDITKLLLKERPHLAHNASNDGSMPLEFAVANNNLGIVKEFLKYVPHVAYLGNKKTGLTPFLVAAMNGFVPIAEEIIRACPDSAYTTSQSWENGLHQAIKHERQNFVEFILRTPQLHRLIYQVDKEGNLPIHSAAAACNPDILRSLLSHKEQDYSAPNGKGFHAVDHVISKKKLWKTLKWNESFTLLSNVIPSGWNDKAVDKTEKQTKKQSFAEVKSLTTKYITNTSVVAALLATITFAAAFTLPGGLSNDASDTGLPIFARKAVFQVFLISDTIAMCFSLAVVFLSILATWEDLDFLLNYRKTSRVLMWCAYGTTSVAFGTGLFTVLAPKILWLAILILVLCSILPFLSIIIDEWPEILLRCRLRRQFRQDLARNIYSI